MKQQNEIKENYISSKENKEMKQNEKRVEEKRNEEMKVEEKRRSVALSADTC